MSPTPTRRGLLLGSGAVVALAACGHRADPVPAVPTAEPGGVVSGSFLSARRGGRRSGWAIAYPPGATTDADLPVAVFLHGRYQDHRTAFGRGAGRLGLDHFLAEQVRRGAPAYAIASVDGGDTYWHPHAGTDSGAMVVAELLPLLAERGLRAAASDRIALTGLSMGGYGALRLAGLLGSGRVAAVAVMSPALWSPGTGFPPAGFSSQADYDRYTAFGRQHQLSDLLVRIDCGTADPFHDATRIYAAGLPASSHPVVHFESGAHDLGFWRTHAPQQLAFVARHLVA